ncbi:MAG: RidA family protein [Cytophagales bacterium]|nr:RidA family protein [Cytophagales bacterium]
MSIAEKVKSLGLELPPVSKPGGNYVSVNKRGNIVYIAIQFPKQGDEWKFKGKLGQELTTEDGYKAMQLCALNVLAQIELHFGEENLLGINHLDAYYQAANDWDEAPPMVDGASDLLVQVLGEKGKHSRAIFGVERLPRNFSVGLTCSITLLN